MAQYPPATELHSALALTEREWQQQVVGLARMLGFRPYHTFDSRRSNPGFPDLVLVGRGRILYIELKSESGKLTDTQTDWIADLKAAGGEVHVWRPSDLPDVAQVLSGRPVAR